MNHHHLRQLCSPNLLRLILASHDEILCVCVVEVFLSFEIHQTLVGFSNQHVHAKLPCPTKSLRTCIKNLVCITFLNILITPIY